MAPQTIEGAINGDNFRAWVEQHLMPTHAPGDIVVDGAERTTAKLTKLCGKRIALKSV